MVLFVHMQETQGNKRAYKEMGTHGQLKGIKCIFRNQCPKTEIDELPDKNIQINCFKEA